MKIIACVPVVNRPDLLRQAIGSLLPFTRHRRLGDGPPPAISAPPYPKSRPPAIDHVLLLDNSGGSAIRKFFASDSVLNAANFEGRLRIQIPTVPLTFAQTQNAFQEITVWEKADAVLFAHSDMAATPEAVERVLAAARRDCIVFSHYDVLAAFGADAIATVGPWDPAIPWYYADNDWYRRVRLAGVEVVEVGGEGVVHQSDASSTIKSDWRIALATNQQTQISRQVYVEKWGGEPGRERYAVPYDGARLTPPVEWMLGDPLYQQLAASYQTHEGTLFEQEPRARAAQLRAIAWAYEAAGRPVDVVETGTAKGFFGFLLAWLTPPGQQTALYTHDGDPRSAGAARLLTEGQQKVQVRFTPGDSKATLGGLDLRGVGLAWVDGGHDEATAHSDLTHCLAAGVPWVLVDDTCMPEVARAIGRALAEHPSYEHVAHPWQADDTRGITVLRRRG